MHTPGSVHAPERACSIEPVQTGVRVEPWISNGRAADPKLFERWLAAGVTTDEAYTSHSKRRSALIPTSSLLLC
jgi:hypothetical protein